MASRGRPRDEERTMATEFVQRQKELRGSQQAALTELARSVLNSNEFLYVD